MSKKQISFQIFICSLLIVLASCSHPFDSRQQDQLPSGMGSITLNISIDAARTILPETPKPDKYELTFYAAGTTTVKEQITVTKDALGTPVVLEEGTYDLKVEAYFNSNPDLIASGRLDDIEIKAGTAVTDTVILKLITNNTGNGTFSWDITLPPVVETATMKVVPLNAPDGLFPSTGTSYNLLGAVSPDASAGEISAMPRGYYQVIIELGVSGGGKLTYFEVLHIYSYLESVFKIEFTSAHFENMLYNIKIVYNDDVTPDGTQSVILGAKITNPGNLTRRFYSFAGWYTTSNFSGSAYDFDAPVTTSFDTLYAKWEVTENGSSDFPWQINNLDDLRAVGRGETNTTMGDYTTGDYVGWTLGKHYLQTNDIDLSDVSNWTPIGTDIAPFSGTYNGGGRTIENLTINRPSTDYQGLFCYISSTGVVENLKLVDCEITGHITVGAVAGWNEEGIVRNCSVTGSVEGYGNVGGVVGENDGTVKNCYFTGSVTGTGGVAFGGVVGINSSNDTMVENCYSMGSVNGFNNVGGVAGTNNGTVKNCYSTASVSGNTGVGGVVGYLHDGEILNCYSTGSVSGSGNVGGILGGYNNGTLEYCIALGPSVSTTGTYVGRVAGVGGALNYNYARSDMLVNNATISGGGMNTIHGADITEGSWGTAAWWTNGARNFSDTVWDFTGLTSGTLPTLKNMPDGAQNPVVQPIPTTAEPDGSKNNPFIVTQSTLADYLTGFATENTHYKLGGDIVADNWISIDLAEGSSLDGNGYTVYNLSQSLFSTVGSGAVVRNLRLENVSNRVGWNLGAVADDNEGIIENCYVSGIVEVASGSDAAGGVVGTNYGTVRNCYMSGEVIGSYYYVGGVVGINTFGGTVENCYSTAAVTGPDSVGGVVGLNTSGSKVQNCVALNEAVEATSGSDIGRVVGENAGNLSDNYARSNMPLILNGSPYSPIEGSGLKDGANVAIGQYNNQAFWEDDLGWDFTDVWEWSSAEQLPVPRVLP